MAVEADLGHQNAFSSVGHGHLSGSVDATDARTIRASSVAISAGV